MEAYYIPYNEKADINYIYLLALYNLAEYNKENKRYDIIDYQSSSLLRDSINDELAKRGIKKISKTTVDRLLNNERYNDYFTIDKTNKYIVLKNNIRGCNKFIVLNKKEANELLKANDNLFVKYYLYIKYYCQYSKSIGAFKQDFTAKQFLAAVGYSTKSNSMISKLSGYNRKLKELGFITITPYRDLNGYVRNLYALR